MKHIETLILFPSNFPSVDQPYTNHIPGVSARTSESQSYLFWGHVPSSGPGIQSGPGTEAGNEPRGDPGPEPTATCWFGPVHPGCEGQNPTELRVLSEPLGSGKPTVCRGKSKGSSRTEPTSGSRRVRVDPPQETVDGHRLRCRARLRRLTDPA